MKYNVNHTLYLQGMTCGILRQLYDKAVSLWETIFDHLRSWVDGRRNKASFSRQKAAVATSVARLCSSIETYWQAWQGRCNPVVPALEFSHNDTDAFAKVFTIWELASNPPRLISELEFLGKGIEPKSFNTERHIAPTKVAVINVSTIHDEQRLESSM